MVAYQPYLTIPGAGFSIGGFISQPKGAGTLPIIFSAADGGTETVTAIPSQKTVVFTMKTPKVWGSDKYQHANGNFLRVANFPADTSVSIVNSGVVAYDSTGHGVLLTGSRTTNYAAFPRGTVTTFDAGGLTLPDAFLSCRDARYSANVGMGAILTDAGLDTSGASTYVFSYKVF